MAAKTASAASGAATKDAVCAANGKARNARKPAGKNGSVKKHRYFDRGHPPAGYSK